MQIVKAVLDEAYAQIDAGDQASKDTLISAQLKSLPGEYAALTDQKTPDIDYSDPVKRFAYIYKYTVAHADYIKQLIERHDSLAQILRAEAPRVACIGGGPGSDLLGVLKFMTMNHVKNVKLTCHVYDKERHGQTPGVMSRMC